MKLFFDTEFTGLHQNTTLISIGIVALDGRYFYAEFNDYNKAQVNDWIQENVIENLMFNGKETHCIEESLVPYNKVHDDDYMSLRIRMKNDTTNIANKLKEWLQQFDVEIQMWSDCLSYDWMLFNQLFGGAQNIPSNINYIPMDICTSFYDKGIDPDISREEFIDNAVEGEKHNSLYDAMVIRECYLKLYGKEV